MKRKVFTCLIRLIGTLAGMLGILVLVKTPFMSFQVPFNIPVWDYIFRGFAILFGVYLLGVGYLVWFKLSPSTVRQMCGVVAISLMGAISNIIGNGFLSDQPWMPLAFLCCLAVAYYAYQAASRYLSAMLFVGEH
jgi:hypothetical protein